MQKRDIAIAVILTIVTCGIYGIIGLLFLPTISERPAATSPFPADLPLYSLFSHAESMGTIGRIKWDRI